MQKARNFLVHTELVLIIGTSGQIGVSVQLAVEAISRVFNRNEP